MIKTTFLLLILSAGLALSENLKLPGQCPCCHKMILAKPIRIETNGVSTFTGERVVHRTIHLQHRHFLKKVEFVVPNDLYTGRIKSGIAEWKLLPPLPK